MIDDIMDTQGRVKIVLDKRVFAQCRDCLVPMLGILSHEAREYCIDHKHVHEGTEVDLKLCAGL